MTSCIEAILASGDDLAPARAKAVRALAKYKRADIRAHYQAIVDAIDAAKGGAA